MAVGSRVLADLRSFQERAREAERYGSDPWVFVRELLQNARDAGAQRVHLTTVEHHGLTSIRCRDDGSGMSFEHARRYLRPLRLGQGGWTRERRPLRRGLLVGPPLRAPADRGALLASRE
ncbi:MAG TPA: ATP-binding protein, partial [Vicinamibacteria bacterium]|nr:ATP-binding protein [Vicinamibacteria bacterium]